MADESNGGHALTGSRFGAFKFASLQKLFGSQRAALVAIVEAVHQVAAESYRGRRGRSETPPGEKDLLSLDQGAYFDRPHHAFVIDGERGSGKTTVLLTLYGYIKAMRFDNALAPAPERADDTIRADLARMDLPPISGEVGNRRVALLLPIVFPETMEPHESAMEAVFAHMDQILVGALEATRIEDERHRRLEELQNWLRRRIGAAWMYSRKIGEQALTNDALTYDEFVVRRAEHNRRSYTRIDTWRSFVDRFLDALGYEVLVLSFDDSDLVPEAADDIMRSIRVYLSHARIVSLMAVELRTLHETLSLFKLTQRSPGLLVGDSTLLRGLVELEKSNIAAQLDKILPTNLRHRLETGPDQLDLIFGGNYGEFCRQAFQRASTVPDGRRGAVSWWLLAGPYAALVSDTARRMVAMHAAATARNHDIDDALLSYAKLNELKPVIGGRLAGVRDAILDGRLRRRELVDRPSYEYHGYAEHVATAVEALLVEFCLDRELALRNLDASAFPELRRWLEGEGRNGARVEAAPRGNQSDHAAPERTLGVAALFPELPLPRNCLYLADLRLLTDTDRTPPSQAAPWVAQLSGQGRSGKDRVRADVEASIQILSSADDGTALEWLVYQFENVRRVSRADDRFVILNRVAMDFAVAPEVLSLVLRAVARGEGRTRDDLVFALRAAEGGSGPRDAAAALPDFLAFADWTRRTALQTWINALKIARRTETLGTLPYEAVADEGPSFVNGPNLIAQSADVLSDSADPRGAALLAWSLGACALPVFDYGFAARNVAAEPEHWDRLLQALRAAGDGLRASTGRERAGQGRRPDRRWLFPDVEATERRIMARDVAQCVAALEDRAETLRKTASNLAERRWPSDPRELAALLLGMTVEAISGAHVVHA
ncbi:hypothetical protein [Methylobacterium oryzae]|uniref:ATP-binding protein n=1 Tax=Methylobacterium oryzae TaxID=334852 RepID=A0ABU7TS63_9HYPH